MPRYRVEITEKTSTTREQWFEAETPEEAQELAEAEDWRTWQEVGSTDVDTGVSMIEDADTGEDVTP
jgi:hypothetical protein